MPMCGTYTTHTLTCMCFALVLSFCGIYKLYGKIVMSEVVGGGGGEWLRGFEGMEKRNN